MTEPRGVGDQDGVELLDYWLVLWRRRWLIVWLCGIIVGTTGAISLMMPKTYEAAASLLTPKEGAGASGLLSGLAASGVIQQIPGLSMPSLTPNRDMLVSIMKSRTLARAVVVQFGLRERYRKKYDDDAIQTLEDTRSISISKEGVITVRVEDRDPVTAARIANFHVEALDQLVSTFGISEAGRQRVFLADQLVLARRNLEGAEDRLRRFQERNRAVVLQEQTRGAVESAARLKGEMMATEVQLQVMRSFATDNNPEVTSLKRRLEEMRRQLAQMQYGEDLTVNVQRPGQGRGRQEIYVPFARVPEVGLELARQTRDVKIHETLVTLLTQQLEQAKIAEAKDMPLVQVLDRALPPERPSRPRLRLNLLIAGVGSLFFGVFLAFFLAYLESATARRRARA